MKQACIAVISNGKNVQTMKLYNNENKYLFSLILPFKNSKYFPYIKKMHEFVLYLSVYYRIIFI